MLTKSPIQSSLIKSVKPQVQRSIATKITFFGEKDKCQNVLGIARSKLNTLVNRLGQGMGMVQQGWQDPITLITGEVIKLAVSLNTCFIEIYAHGLPQQGLGARQEIIKTECFCGCHFAKGFIIRAPYAPCCYSHLLSSPPLYDIEVCQGQQDNKRFEFFINIPSMDFTPYLLGDPVIIAYVPTSGTYINTFGIGCNMTATQCAITSLLPPIGRLTRTVYAM